MPGIILGTGDTGENRIDKHTYFCGAHILMEGDRRQTDKQTEYILVLWKKSQWVSRVCVCCSFRSGNCSA